MENKLWFLEGYQDNGKSWIIEINEFPFIIGRSKNCNLTLAQSSISREHAKIFKQKNELFLEDCNSTNGTLLNSRKLTKITRLFESDTITICDSEFILTSKKDTTLDDLTIISSGDAPINSFSKRFNLTKREEELLSYLIKGSSTREIAKAMFISTGTAKNHILNLFKKTDTHSRIELITSFNKY